MPGERLGWEPAPTNAGDHVVVRAEMDSFLAVSACPQDIVPINDKNPMPVASSSSKRLTAPRPAG